MKNFLFFILFFPLFLQASSDLFEDENPSLFHHVNVITGDLNLHMEDAEVVGAKPLSILRSYSSSGSLERTSDHSDLKLKNLRGGFLIQGGWSFFPHANLLIRPGYHRKHFEAYVSDPQGDLTKIF